MKNREVFRRMTGGELLPIVNQTASQVTNSSSVKSTLSHVWDSIVGDRVVAWRIKNAAKQQEALEKELASRSLKLDREKIPDSFAFKWFERISETEEPEIHDLFAKLIVNAGEGNEDALRKRNIELIAQFSPNDAKLFEVICDLISYNEIRDIHYFNQDETQLRNVVYEAAEFIDEISFETLERLSILIKHFSVDETQLHKRFDALEAGRNYARFYFNESVRIRIDVELGSTGLSLAHALYPEKFFNYEPSINPPF